MLGTETLLVLLVVQDSESTAALIFCMLTIFVDEKRGDALVVHVISFEGFQLTKIIDF